MRFDVDKGIFVEDVPDENSTILHGEGAPDENIGRKDDFYIDIIDWEIYGPKEDVWGDGRSLAGRDGEDGESIKGEGGKDGKDGESIRGDDGEHGIGIVEISESKGVLIIRLTNGDSKEFNMPEPLRGESGIGVISISQLSPNEVSFKLSNDSEHKIILPQGNVGVSPILRTFENHIQWKYPEDKEWINLAPLPKARGGGAHRYLELFDTNVKDVTDGQGVTWDDTTSKWIPADVLTTSSPHSDLGDMPDVAGTNTDHDARYHTKADLASTNNNLGASLIGVEDDGTFYTAANVEAVLQEIGVTLFTPDVGDIDINSAVVNFIDFDPQVVDPSFLEGRVFYDATNDALSVLTTSDVTIQLGQEDVARVGNATGSTLSDGKVVFYNGGVFAGIPTVALAIADPTQEALEAIAVVTEDIENNSIGFVTERGVVNNLDTSAFTAGDPLFLSGTTAGEITNVKPLAPDFTIRIGYCRISNATTGSIEVSVEIETPITSSFDGMQAEQLSISLVEDGGTIFAEVVTTEGSNKASIIFSQDFWILDTLTGAGTGGAARVALTAGASQSVHQTNYIFIEKSGTPNEAQLSASTALPVGEFSWVGQVELPDVTTFNTIGAFGLHRLDDSLAHDGRGAISYHAEKLRQSTDYEDGILPSVNIVTNAGAPDNVNMDTTLGSVYQLHRQAFPSFVTVHDYYVVNDSVSPYTTITDLNALLTDANGVTMSNRYIVLILWGNSDNQAEEKIFVNLPIGSYNSALGAITDTSNLAVTTIPIEFKKTGFLIAKLVFKHNPSASGTWVNTLAAEIGVDFIDLRGQPPGFNSASSGTPAMTEFQDDVFKIFDNVDVTKTARFEASGITTGNDRVYTFPDASGTLGLFDGISGGQVLTGGTDAADTLTLRSDSTSPTAVVIGGAVFRSTVDDTDDLGASILQWKKVFARDIELRGTTPLIDFKTASGEDADIRIRLDVAGTGFRVDTGGNGSLVEALGIDGSQNATFAGDITAKTSDGAILTLQTSDTTVEDGDILGRIDFQAPNEASGTDAILVAASIYAEADDTFASDNNGTDIVIATAISGVATETARFTKDGTLLIELDKDSRLTGVQIENTNVVGKNVDFMLINAVSTWAFRNNAAGNFLCQETATGGVEFQVDPSGNGSFLGGLIVNEAGADNDFRVESDTQTHSFFHDGAGGGNTMIGGSAIPASGASTLSIFNGTAPTGSVANGFILYSEDDSGSAEGKTRDEAGNINVITPHNFSMFDPDASYVYPWSFYHENPFIGKRMSVDMEGLVREVERLSGKILIYIEDIPKENWAAHQEAIRLGVEDANAMIQIRIDELTTDFEATEDIDEKKEMMDSVEGLQKMVQPEYEPKQPPAWMVDRM